MRILSIQNNANVINTNKPRFCAAKLKPALNKDTFFRTEPQDFLSLPTKEVFSRIKKSIKKSENKLGRGGEADVWKIEDSSYCIRIPVDSIGKFAGLIDKNLTNNDKVNHVVAKLNGGVTIMPIIEGCTFCSDNVKDDDVAKMIEKMPIESYKNLIRQIYNAESMTDMVFDSGWKNIIINSDKMSMTAIDFYKTKDRDIFANQILSSIYASLANNPSTTFEQKQTCAGKLILASTQLIKDEKLDLSKFGLNRFLSELKNQKILDNSNYIKLIKNNFEILSRSNSNNASGAYKILVTLMKQLLNVTI